MGRPRLKDKQRQVPVALPPKFRSRLERAAKVARHSIAEEIRRRIALTFEIEAIDGATREVQQAIANLAERLEADCGAPWYTSRQSHEAFVAAVSARLTAYRPCPPETGSLNDQPSTSGSSEVKNLKAQSSSAKLDVILVDAETIGRIRELDDRQRDGYRHLWAAISQRADRAVRELNEKAEKKP